MAQQVQADRVLVNDCRWIKRYRQDGTTYNSRVVDCGKTTCKWSDKYDPRQESCGESGNSDSVEQTDAQP
ncbi:hypothetical protein GGS24DRAFT_454199 [Hypoxylon argillaceum]|nr:hypothetical protein GGS24DRAFT_454199 [Hypoxylon argillaceum]